MLLGLLLFRSGTATTPVLVAAHDLVPGEPLTSDDFRVREIVLDGSFAALTLDEQQILFGDGVTRTLRSFVPEGTIVSEAFFVARAQALEPGQVVVGIQLKPGQFPPDLVNGDIVELYAVGERAEPQAAVIGRASIRYSNVSAQSGDLIAELLIDDDSQSRVIQAEAVDQLRLALVRG